MTSAYLRTLPGQPTGSLNFDQRAVREDEATACAISNLLVRSRGDWRRRFMHVPNFTVSSVSPGLQAADVVTYLGACFSSVDARPELTPYLDEVRHLAHYLSRSGRQRTFIREIEARALAA